MSHMSVYERLDFVMHRNPVRGNYTAFYRITSCKHCKLWRLVAQAEIQVHSASTLGTLVTMA